MLLSPAPLDRFAPISLADVPAIGTTGILSKEPLQRQGSGPDIDPDLLLGHVVLICADRDSDVVMMRDWISQLGGKTIRIPRLSSVLPHLSCAPDARLMLVLDAPMGSDLDQLISECYRLRLRRPNMPIVLTSPTFGRHDFSTDRRAICDVCLRDPVTRLAFTFGLSAALSNNRDYCRALRDDTPPDRPTGDSPERQTATEPQGTVVPGPARWFRVRCRSMLAALAGRVGRVARRGVPG